MVTGPRAPPRPGEVLLALWMAASPLAQALPGQHLLLQGLLSSPQRHLRLCHRLLNGLLGTAASAWVWKRGLGRSEAWGAFKAGLGSSPPLFLHP